ncbi:MAG: hypothetical protein M3494_10140 [Actinomycetota bacterium]|nr:hypothetical protein [Actinomycetota bacterium]
MSISTGTSAPSTMYSPLSWERIFAHFSHSEMEPVILIDSGATRETFAPRRSWTRIHGSKRRPSESRFHRT